MALGHTDDITRAVEGCAFIAWTEQKCKCVKHTHNSIEDKCVLTMLFNRMYEGNCYNNHSINNNLEIRAQGLSYNQMLESSVCCHSKQTSALFLSESSFIDGEEKLHTIAFY